MQNQSKTLNNTKIKKKRNSAKKNFIMITFIAFKKYIKKNRLASIFMFLTKMKEGNKFYNSTLILNSFHKSPAIEDEDHKIRYDALNHLYQYFQTDEYETYLKQSKATPPTKELLLREKDQIWLFFLDPMNRRVCFEDS